MAHAACPPRARRVAIGTALLLALSGIGPAAVADGEFDQPPEQPFEITPEVLADSVSSYDPADSVSSYDPVAAVRSYDLEGAVTSLGAAETERDDVIVLETDILFSSNAWELPDSAGERLAELAEEIPQGATVQVGGHTDSKPVDSSRFDFDNQQLSTNRAQAVADALAAQRPDLTLEVTGHGSDQPAVTENPEDPSTYAANRRVELLYGETG